MRKAASVDAARLIDRYGVVLNPAPREAAAYRPFEDEDFAAIRRAIAPKLSPETREALDTV